MYLEDLKRWHWMLIGLIAGLAVGYAITLPVPKRDAIVRTPLSAEQFVAFVHVPAGNPRSIRNLQIDPAQGGYNFVTGEAMLSGAYRPFAFYASRPFVASPDVRADSVLDYVKSIQPDVRVMYTNPWWRATWFEISASSFVGSSRVDLQACKLEYSIVSPK